MITTVHARDLRLPERSGDAELCPPEPHELMAQVAERLALPGAPAPLSAELLLARWKPGVSTTVLWRVELEGGLERLVVAKQFKSDKLRHLAARTRVDPRVVELCRPFACGHVWIARGLYLWTFPADRVLPGLPRLLDRGRTKRWIVSAGLAAGRLHRKDIRTELLRYKPERRAVHRLELELKGRREPAKMAARVLPPEEAQRVARARQGLAGYGVADITPRLLASETGRGLLLEEWLSVESGTPERFEWSAAAGALLARLHAAPLPHGVPASPSGKLAELPPLFAALPEAARALRALAEPSPERASAWIHGDLHPDQIARSLDHEGFVLLDLDQLGAGDPLRDLGGWVADQLAAQPGTSLRDAAGPLLEGYRRGGGRAVALAELAPFVATALVLRAAAALRRLEAGALDYARSILERACELRGGGAAS